MKFFKDVRSERTLDFLYLQRPRSGATLGYSHFCKISDWSGANFLNGADSDKSDFRTKSNNSDCPDLLRLKVVTPLL